jgi:replication factor A1
MNGITVTGRIVSISDKREVETRYGRAHVANAVLEDDTGKMVLNLWRSQIDSFKVGDIIKIENGFV